MTCHDVHRSETKLMFKALSLTYEYRRSVGPPASCPLCEPPAAKRCKEHNRPDTVHISSWLTFFRLHSHTSWELADWRRPRRGNHAYISCSLFRDETRCSFGVWSSPRLLASDGKQRRRKLLSSSQYFTSIFYQEAVPQCSLLFGNWFEGNPNTASFNWGSLR